jgi:hypothetical protein
MSQRRVIALAAVLAIGAAAVLSVAQWVNEAANDASAQLHAGPTVALPHGALRPVDGRPEQVWGRAQRRLPRTLADPAALAALATAVVAVALFSAAGRRRANGLLLGAAHGRSPPVALVP